jgi:hypothetical protein
MQLSTVIVAATLAVAIVLVASLVIVSTAHGSTAPVPAVLPAVAGGNY